MYVRQLIGPLAGRIIEMPYHAGQSCIAMGTAASVSDAEVVEAGFKLDEHNPINAPVTLPEGFSVLPRPDRGFDLFYGDPPKTDDPEFNWVGTGVQGPEPLPNLPAARDAAQEYLSKLSADGESGSDDEPVVIPEDFRELSISELRELAASLGVTATRKADIIAEIESILESRASDQ